MTYLTKTLAFALAVAAAFSGCAAAATLAFSSTSLAAGNAAISSCGIVSLVATRNVNNAGNVTRVDVERFPCVLGETLAITFVGAANASLGNGSRRRSAAARRRASAAITSFSGTTRSERRLVQIWSDGLT